VPGVTHGVKYDELFDTNGKRIGESANEIATSPASRRPGDIHRVHDVGDVTAISVHSYGTDVTRVESSARRYHDDEPEDNSRT
jgi:hypothetical protein